MLRASEYVKKNKDVFEVFFAFLALAFSVIALVQNANQDASNKQLQATADAREEASFKPGIWVFPLVANSPDLKAQEDIETISKLSLKPPPRVIPTAYQKELANKAVSDKRLRYLFVLIANRGAMAKDITIGTLQWIPKSNQALPQGIGEIPALHWLDSGEAFALLVDEAERMDNDDPLAASHAENVCLASITYTDRADRPYPFQGPICIRNMEPPIKIAPEY